MNSRVVLIAASIVGFAAAVAWTMRNAGTPDPVTSSAIPPPSRVESAVDTTETPRSSTPATSEQTQDTSPAEEPPPEEQCEAVIRDAMTELSRYDDERFESIRIDVEQLGNYRGLGIDQLKSLAVQGDADAMIVLTMAVVTEAIGLGDTKAVPLAQGEIDPDRAGLNKAVVLDKLKELELSKEASYWLYEAAVHGRLEAFAQAGGPLEGFTAVDMGWLDAEAYAEVPAKHQRLLDPESVYATAYFLIDPNLLPSGAEAGYEQWQSDQRDAYGPFFDSIVQPLADRFVADMENRGLSMPEIAPRRSIEEYLETGGSGCRPE